MGKPKGKIVTQIKAAKPVMYVKMIGHTKPKFAHNAILANKDVTWTYEFWRANEPDNVGKFDLEMDLDVCKKMVENKQSEHMNDAAISFVEGHYAGCEVKLTSK